jgi:hypothetical protein
MSQHLGRCVLVVLLVMGEAVAVSRPHIPDMNPEVLPAIQKALG